MALSFRIPGIVTLAAVRAPAEVAAVDDAVGVDRMLSGRGGLVNRAIAGKLSVFRTADGRVWPAFASRGDLARAAQQHDLEAKLSDSEALVRRLTSEIGGVADCIRDGSSSMAIGVAVQRLVGRLFFADYVSDEASFAAALTLSKWLSAGPLASRRLRRSGELQRALDLVLARARGDTACAHATALALHNIVDAVGRMQRLARRAGELARITSADAVTQTLQAPPRVIREVKDSVKIGGCELPARSLVLVSVEAARKRSRDEGTAFFVNHWNQCPAHSIVPRLLAEVWRTAAAKPGAGT